MDNERVKWLNSLKEGDVVAYRAGSLSYAKWRTGTIGKITPTRRFVVGTMKLDSNGNEMGKTGSWTRATSIEPVTQEILESIEKNDLIDKLSRIKIEGLSLNQLRKINKTLEEK